MCMYNHAYGEKERRKFVVLFVIAVMMLKISMYGIPSYMFEVVFWSSMQFFGVIN